MSTPTERAPHGAARPGPGSTVPTEHTVDTAAEGAGDAAPRGTIKETPSAHAQEIDQRAEAAARLAVAIGRINRRIRPRGDLTQSQLSALSTIARKGPLRPSDVARVEAVAAPSATRVVAELEARGLVERHPDPDDGRSSLVSSTEAGAAAVLTARAERARRISVLLAGLDDEEFATVAGALDALEIVSVYVPLT